MWKKLRTSVSSMFRRSETGEEEVPPPTTEPPIAERTDAELLELELQQEQPEIDARYGGADDAADQGLGSAAHAVASRGTTPAEPPPAPTSDADLFFLDIDPLTPPAPVIPAEPVAPPEDFKFPWSRPADAPEGGSVAAESATDDALVVEKDEEPLSLPDEQTTPPAADTPKSPGFLGRLFGKRASQEQPAEPEPLSVADEVASFATSQPEEDDDGRDTAEMEAVSDADPFEPLDVDAGMAVEEPSGDDEPGFFGRLFGRRKRDADLTPAADSSRDWTDLDTHGMDAVAARTLEPMPAPPAPLAPPAIAASLETPDPFEPVVPPEADFAETLDVVQPAVSADAFTAEPAVAAATIDDEISERTDEFEVPTVLVPGPEGEDTADVEPAVPPPGILARLLRRTKTAAEQQQPEVEPGFLHAKFRQFYSEILRFKNQKSQLAAGFATAIVDYAADISPDASAQQLSNRLKELLELQSAEAAWMKGEYAHRYPHAQYAMAALADEIFSELEWPGKPAWPRYRLEQRLFKSSDAGLEFFKRVDRLLREEVPTAEARDLARVYLLVLASGFRGKWRPFNLKRPIAEYRRRLYEFMTGGDDALMLYADDHTLMPQAMAHTLVGHAVSRFTAAQRWTAILVLLLIVYVVAAHMAWSRVSADLKDLTARIVSSGIARGAP